MCEQHYFPSKVSRSVKLMTKKFESENIYIEYTLHEVPQDQQAALISEVNVKMQEFLVKEEKKIREKYGEPDLSAVKVNTPKQNLAKPSNNKVTNPPKHYDIIITEEGKKLQQSLNGEFKIVKEEQGDYQNFIHLWLHTPQKMYIGHLHKLNGNFKFKEANNDKIQLMKIQKGVHFKVIESSKEMIVTQSIN